MGFAGSKYEFPAIIWLVLYVNPKGIFGIMKSWSNFNLLCKSRLILQFSYTGFLQTNFRTS